MLRGSKLSHHRKRPAGTCPLWTRSAAHSGRSGRLARMLRWLTAGESHGPLLTAILEGLPAHVQVTTQDVADALARRRLGYGRGARMKFEQDEVRLTGGVRHGADPGRAGRHRDRQHRVAQVGPGDERRPGRPGRARRAGAQRGADPPAARARRPGGDAEVRLRRGPPGAGARLRPGDRGARGAGTGGLRLPRAGDRRPAGLPRGRARRRPGARRLGARRPTTWPASTRTRCAASTPTPRS